MVDDDPADEEDDDFEVELEAVDVVSFALGRVSLGFNALVSGSILAATAPITRGFGHVTVGLSKSFLSSFSGGHMPCQRIFTDDSTNEQPMLGGNTGTGTVHVLRNKKNGHRDVP